MSVSPMIDRLDGSEDCNRILPGTSCSQNKDSISFGQEGLVAYGCRNLVVVVESATAQVIQTLHKHKHSVLRTAWSVSVERSLGLASADTMGNIVIWDLDSGESVRHLQDGAQPVTDIRWMDSRIAKTGNLLLAIHSPNQLILWNTWTGSKVWKYTSNEATILSLDFCPFNTNRILLLSTTSVLMLDDFQATKCPTKEPKKFYIMNTKGGSPGRTFNNKDANTASTAERRMSDVRQGETKLSKVMRQMVLGDSRMSPSHQSSEATHPSHALSALFHKCMRDVIILSYPTEITLLDMKLCQVICSINLERIHSPVVSTYSCSNSDVIFVLHESGSVSVWRRKPNLSVLATPAVVTRNFSMMAGLAGATGQTANSGTSAANHRNSVASLDTSFDTAGSDLVLEIGYESRVQSEHVRMGKNSRVLGMSVHPINQQQIAFLTSDGRIYILEYDDAPNSWQNNFLQTADNVSAAAAVNQKLSIRSVIGSNAGQLTRIKMCPHLTLKNELKYRPLLAAAAKSGNILVYNTYTGKLEREICVHTSAIVDLEWISDNPATSILSCSHSTVSGSSLVRNELIHTNIITGKTKLLRTERGDEPKITMIRVSSALQFFVLAFSHGPFELWDAAKLCLLRTMPKKFPHVSAITWSPTHRSKKKNSTSSESRTPADNKTKKTLPQKEHILFSDLDSQLFHFTVEGHSIRDGSKIPAETGLGLVNSLTCKSDLIVRGDTEGNINIWNMKARQSKNIHTGRGNIKLVKFAPGGGKTNLKLLAVYGDGMAIWDLKEMEIVNELRSPRVIPEVEYADWISSSRVCVLCTDGSIFTMGLALVTSPTSTLAIHTHQDIRCPSFLESKLMSRLAFSLAVENLHHIQDTAKNKNEAKLLENIMQAVAESPEKDFLRRNLKFAHFFGLNFEHKLWTLLYSKRKGALSGGYDFFCDKQTYSKRELDKCKLYLNRAGADSRTRSLATARLLAMGQLEPVVKLLLETDPSDEFFLSDQFLACLISTTSNAVDCNQLSTTKLVATKLIAEGSLWEGVQLLCLVGKVWDACTYLRAGKHWDETIWLAKLRLSDQEYLDICKKYAEFLINQGRHQEAALLHASNHNWEECLTVLHLGQFRSLSLRLLDYISSLEEGVKLDPVLVEAVRLEGARFLLEVGHLEAAEQYCGLIADKGKELLSEYNNSMAFA